MPLAIEQLVEVYTVSGWEYLLSNLLEQHLAIIDTEQQIRKINLQRLHLRINPNHELGPHRQGQCLLILVNRLHVRQPVQSRSGHRSCPHRHKRVAPRRLQDRLATPGRVRVRVRHRGKHQRAVARIAVLAGERSRRERTQRVAAVREELSMAMSLTNLCASSCILKLNRILFSIARCVFFTAAKRLPS